MNNYFSEINISINPISKNISTNKGNSSIMSDLNAYFKAYKKMQIYLPENRRMIYNGLLREFSRLVYGEKERIRVGLFVDEVYNRAVDIIISDEYYENFGY